MAPIAVWPTLCWLAAFCLLFSACQRPAPQAPAPLAIAVSGLDAGADVTIEVRSDPPAAGQPVTVTVVAPGKGRPIVEREGDFFGLGGVQLLWLPPEQREREAQLAAAIGAQIIGLDFDWRRIEPQKGVFDWQATDEAVALAKKYGLQVAPMLLYTPRWASSFPEALLDSHIYPPANDDDYRQFVYAVVERYKPYGRSPLTHDGYGITDWVIWNEPGVYPSHLWPAVRNEFWTGGMEAYVRLLRVGYEGVHAACPDCNVLNGGLADVTWAEEALTLPQVVERLYDPNGDGDSADGGRPYFDTLNIHTYPPGEPDEAWYTERIQAVRAVMERFGDADKSIWLTETGYGTAADPQDTFYLTEAEQARGVQVAYESCAHFPYVERVFWWSLRDYYGDSSAANPAMEAHYGLLQASFAPKLSFFAYGRLTGALGEQRSWVVHTGADGTARLALSSDAFAAAGDYLVFAVTADGYAASLVVKTEP